MKSCALNYFHTLSLSITTGVYYNLYFWTMRLAAIDICLADRFQLQFFDALFYLGPVGFCLGKTIKANSLIVDTCLTHDPRSDFGLVVVQRSQL